MFMIKIAIDAMGSDKGSSIVVAAVKKFVAEYNDVELHVVGKKEELKEIESLAKIIDAREVMEMEDGALEVMRCKDTSMMMALDLALNGANAVVSAGGTAALLTGATVKLKLINNVQRAALCAPFPTENGRTVAILDIGANNENTPEHLVQFAKMGSIFSKQLAMLTHMMTVVVKSMIRIVCAIPLKNHEFIYYQMGLKIKKEVQFLKRHLSY
jgi:glycerol-3-phosphate acyltransferase PlsX